MPTAESRESTSREMGEISAAGVDEKLFSNVFLEQLYGWLSKSLFF
jgi:hypothetical protein